jgi:hypothetical protein
MELKGTVQGPAACKYLDYTYLEPIVWPLDMWTMYPDRWHPVLEFPRDVIKITKESCLHLRSRELADYMVRIGETDNTGAVLVEVWMMPNEHTAAREQRLVLQFQVAHEAMMQLGKEKILEFALERVFS